MYNKEQEQQPHCQNVVPFGVERQQDEDKGCWGSAGELHESVGAMSPVSPFKVFGAHNSKGLSQGATQQLLLPKCKTQGLKPRLCGVSLPVNSISPLICESHGCLYDTLFVASLCSVCMTPFCNLCRSLKWEVLSSALMWCSVVLHTMEV